MKQRSASSTATFMVTSLMDAFTIILFFLIKQFGADPVSLRERDAQKSFGTPLIEEQIDATVIGISAQSIQVDDEKVVDLRNGAVDPRLKDEGALGLLINPLHKKLEEKMRQLKSRAAKSSPLRSRTEEPESLALIVAYKNTSYRLVTEVLYTAGQAEIEKFKFVAVEDELEK